MSFNAPASPGIWEEFATTWNSASDTVASILVVDSYVAAYGNDFALDDLSLADPNCGNGILDAGEECDDGNNVDGDGCAADCTIEQDVPATTYRGMAVAVLLLLVAATAFLLQRRATH